MHTPWRRRASQDLRRGTPASLGDRGRTRVAFAGVPDRSPLVARVGATLLSTRWFARAPIQLYRLGLGPLIGTRLVLLEHRGRRSGLPRTVVLEVIAIEDGAPVAVSGFGERAQWCRNVVADPDARAWWGTRAPRAVRVVRMTTARSREVLADYASKKPRAWRSLRATMEASSGTSLDPAVFDLPMFVLARRA